MIRAHTLFPKQRVNRYPPKGSTVVVLPGAPSGYVGQTGEVLCYRGLGRIQIKLSNSGVVTNIDARYLRQYNTGESHVV